MTNYNRYRGGGETAAQTIATRLTVEKRWDVEEEDEEKM
jgi:hypothetical protein